MKLEKEYELKLQHGNVKQETQECYQQSISHIQTEENIESFSGIV